MFECEKCKTDDTHVEQVTLCSEMSCTLCNECRRMFNLFISDLPIFKEYISIIAEITYHEAQKYRNCSLNHYKELTINLNETRTKLANQVNEWINEDV